MLSNLSLNEDLAQNIDRRL